MNRLSETQQNLIIKLYNTMQGMISVDNIENTDNLKAKMAFILLQKPFIPTEFFSLIENYLNDSIMPIIDNNEPICYLDSELGFINENGLFEFYSLKEFRMYFDKINDLCTHLKNKLENTFLAFICPD
jgi:hypothetical protein